VTPLEQSIEALIAPVVAAAGFELVRVRLSGTESKTLQIMAERPDKTMSAEDCAVLSRALSPLLDEKDPIPGQYRLEVSSPGIDRPLVRLSDYHDWQGYEAKIELDRLVEGRKKFSGVLGGLEGDTIILDIAGEEEAALIPFSWIKSGKLVLSDELIRESLRAAKAAQTQEAADESVGEDEGDQA
jgi:ribosome maturation factor RimP